MVPGKLAAVRAGQATCGDGVCHLAVIRVHNEAFKIDIAIDCLSV